MKTGESIQHGSINQQGLSPGEEKQESNFWGIVFMVVFFAIVIAALALLLL